MQEISDETYMERVKNGQLSDMAPLFERYHVRMYNFFLQLTNDKALSQELSQELFYRVLKHRSGYRPVSGGFKKWIYTIARNLHIDYRREQVTVRARSDSVEEGHENIAVQPERYTETDYSKLDRSLQELDIEQRQVLVMSRYQGLKYEEIAGILGLSVSAVKVRVHRSILALRKLYFKNNQ